VQSSLALHPVVALRPQAKAPRSSLRLLAGIDVVSAGSAAVPVDAGALQQHLMAKLREVMMGNNNAACTLAHVCLIFTLHICALCFMLSSRPSVAPNPNQPTHMYVCTNLAHVTFHSWKLCSRGVQMQSRQLRCCSSS
jgi:hypothetical protein